MGSAGKRTSMAYKDRWSIPVTWKIFSAEVRIGIQNLLLHLSSCKAALVSHFPGSHAQFPNHIGDSQVITSRWITHIRITFLRFHPLWFYSPQIDQKDVDLWTLQEMDTVETWGLAVAPCPPGCVLVWILDCEECSSLWGNIHVPKRSANTMVQVTTLGP